MAIVKGLTIKFKKFIETLVPQVDGLTEEDVEELHLKNPLSKYVLPVSYDPEMGYFLSEDNTVMLMFELAPSLGLSESDINLLLSGLFKLTTLPPNTLIQFSLWASPYVEPMLKKYVEMRPADKRWLAEKFAEFYRKHIYEGFYPDWLCPVRNFRLFFSLKIPCSIEKYEKKKRDFFFLREQIYSTLKSAHLCPSYINAEHLIRVLYLLLNPGHDPEHEKDLFYNPDVEIRDHVIKGDTVIEQEFNYLKVDSLYGKALTVDIYPKEFDLMKVRGLIGSIMGDNAVQINCPFIFSLVLRKCTDSEVTSVHTKDAMTPKIPDNSMFSGMFTKQKERAEEAFYAANRVTEDGVLWKGCLIWYLYHPDFEYLTRAVNTLKNFALAANFVLQEEIANLPLFLSCLPGNLCAAVLDGDVKQEGKKKRTFPFGRAATYFAHNCVNALPVQADWSGTPTPAMPFIGRMGQLAFIDLWDTNQSKNALVIAPTGSGKSFLSNHIACHYWSLNALVRVIDVGRSYEALANLLGGQFIEIDPANPITINPFSEVENLDTEMSLLVSIVAKMIKPTEKITDREGGIIERAIRTTFERYGRDTDITKIRDTLLQMHKTEADKLFKDMAVDHLAPWVEGGQYGRLVNGKNQVNLHAPFVVFELGKAESYPTLKNVVLLIAFYHISREIYQGSRDVKKLVLWDEAWRFLDDAFCLEQIMRAVREYRKFNAAAVIVTQSVSDFEGSQSAKVITENTHFKFLLQQDPGKIAEMKKQGTFGIPPFGFELLKTVRTEKGKYSEIYAMTNMNGQWVTRFIVPPGVYWIYTTDPDDVTLRNLFLESGMSISEVMDKCEEIAKYPELMSFWRDVAVKKQQGVDVDLNACFEREKEILKWLKKS